MRKHPVVFDLETKHTFREFNDPRKLEISVAALYDYNTQQGHVFTEAEVTKLFPFLEHASYIVGFNVQGFDMEVLAPYYPGDIQSLPCFDILEDIRLKIGHRISLNDLISATLGKKKTGHGLMAIEYYKEGRWDELKQYCLDDVMLTAALFDHGVKQGAVNYLNETGKVDIKVDWQKYMEEVPDTDTPLTLPF